MESIKTLQSECDGIFKIFDALHIKLENYKKIHVGDAYCIL